MNAVLFAVLASVATGVVYLPWSVCLKELGPGGLFLFLGLVFLAAGSAIQSSTDRTLLLAIRLGTFAMACFIILAFRHANTPWPAILRVLGTAVLYVVAISFMNAAISISTPASLPIVAVIISTFAIWCAVANGLWTRSIPSGAQLLFMGLALASIVGLALVSKEGT
jgi:hypothetical protein